MLDRLQAAFEAQRRFVANASHELRTPLAVMRTEVDVTLADPDADVDGAAADGRGGAGGDATGPTGWSTRCWCWPARPRRGPRLAQREPVDLADLVVPALAAVRAEAAARGLRCAAATRPARRSDGDPALLERLVGNLVENAVRHNVAGGWLEVCTGPVPIRRAEGAELRVAYSGPEVRPDRGGRAVRAVPRGAPAARTGRRGAGLGLSIVRAVVPRTAARWRPARWRAAAWRSRSASPRRTPSLPHS